VINLVKLGETIKSELEELPATSDKVVKSCPPSDPPSPPPCPLDRPDLKHKRGLLLFLEAVADSLLHGRIKEQDAKTLTWIVQTASGIVSDYDQRIDQDYPPEEQERRVKARKEAEKKQRAREQKWRREHPGQEPGPLDLLY
jgi:hypothetical protein